MLLFGAMTIFLMVLPPLFDTFDNWDTKPELPVVGHNVETTVVVVSVDLSLCFVVAWVSTLLLKWLLALFSQFAHNLAPVSIQPNAYGIEYLLLLFSPPWRLTSLRI